MKKLFLTLAIVVSTLVGTAQDGLARWIDTDSTDVFISIYNSSADVRVDLANLLYSRVIKYGEPKAGPCTLTIHDIVIKGEMFVLKGASYELYDFYVDVVLYPDKAPYRATRFEKPKGPIDYSK